MRSILAARSLCCFAMISVLFLGGSVLACTQPQAPRPPANPPPPPPKCFKLIDGLDAQGRTRVFVWCEVKVVFQTTTPHNCACGLGLSTALLPADTVAVAAQVGIADMMTGTILSTIPQFDALARNPASDPAFASGPGPTQQNPALPQLGQAAPGATWFGFGGVVQPVNPPPLGPNQIFVLCFELRTLNPTGLMNAIGALNQIAGGLGNETNGLPLFDQNDPHSVTYSEVPEPAVASIIPLAGLFAAARRRK